MYILFEKNGNGESFDGYDAMGYTTSFAKAQEYVNQFPERRMFKYCSTIEFN